MVYGMIIMSLLSLSHRTLYPHSLRPLSSPGSSLSIHSNVRIINVACLSVIRALLVSWRAGSVRGICDIWNKRSKIVWYIQSLRQDKTGSQQQQAQPTDIQTFLLRFHFYEKGEANETFNSSCSWISPPHWFKRTCWPGYGVLKSS